MAEITIFTAPKPFQDPHIATIQRNAILSWCGLGAEVDVLLVGDEPGMPEAAADLGVGHLPAVARNRWGTPLVSSIFALARAATTSPLLAYVNADILLMPDFVAASHCVAGQFDRFLIVGQRWDLSVNEPLEFEEGWPKRLRDRVTHQGRLHRAAGSDYFVFPRAGFTEIPDFAIGRAGWDNWMIYHARRSGWPVVDATQAVMVVHQDHDYSHLPGNQPHYLLEESDLNRALAGGKANMYILLDADRRLANGQIHAAPPSLARSLRQIENFLTPPGVKPRGARWWLVRRLRRLRRALTREKE